MELSPPLSSDRPPTSSTSFDSHLSQQKTTDPEDDAGDLGISSLATSTTKRRDVKGKGRMRDVVEEEESGHGHAAGGGEEGEEEEMGPEEMEREERRVAENLAQWSQTEKLRRQSSRRTSTLILPTAPIFLSDLSELTRKGSQIVRQASRRRPGGSSRGDGSASSSFRQPEEEEGSSNLESRRTVRMQSVRLASGGAISRKQQVEAGEEGHEMDEIVTPTSLEDANNKHHPTLTRPKLRHGSSSRFIEHLPQDQTPENPFDTTDSHTTTTPPEATPRTSIDDLLLTNVRPSLSSRDSHSSNPFANSHSAYEREGSNSDTSTMRRDSDLTERGFERFGAGERRRGSEMSVGSTRELISEEGANDGGTGSMNSTAYESRTHSWNESQTQWGSATRRNDDVTGEDEEREEKHHTRRTGLLDWLLCGCFGAELDEEASGAQAGRTNPME